MRQASRGAAIEGHGREQAPPSRRRGLTDSGRLNRIAADVRAGFPPWEIGYDPAQIGLSESPVQIDGNPDLFVETGALDESHAAIRAGDATYHIVKHALERQDTWKTADEHASFWSGVLPLLRQGGKTRNQDALAYAVALAVVSCAAARREVTNQPRRVPSEDQRAEFEATAADDLNTALGRLGFALQAQPEVKRDHADLEDLERLGILSIAVEMLLAPRHELRDTGRLPRVVTEPRWVPIAVQSPYWEDMDRIGEASYIIRREAHRAVQHTLTERIYDPAA